MAGEKALTAEQQRKRRAEKLWLVYFNQYLYEQNIITETQRNRLALQIESRKDFTPGAKEKREYGR